MKTLIAATVFLSLGGAAMAQTPATAPASGGSAAATLPNSFDRPTRAPAAAPQATPPASDPAKVAAAEAMLKTTIAAMQAGTPNYGDMSPTLAEKVREVAPQITPIIQGFGAVQSLTHVGVEDGAELFVVVFAQLPTQWIIALDDTGKMRALLFRPVPPPVPAA